MDGVIIDRIIDNWQRLNYVEPIWIVSSVFSIVVGIRNYKGGNIYRLLLLYPLASLALTSPVFFTVTYLLNFAKKDLSVALEVTNTLFSAFELSVFFHLFKEVIPYKSTNKMLKAIGPTFILGSFFFLIYLITKSWRSNEVVQESNILGCIEFLFILPFCFIYFYCLITKDAYQIDLSDTPSFWIISGLFFYSIVSLPYLLLTQVFFSEFEGIYNLMGSIHYISLSVLFLFLSKAFKCTKTITK